MYENIFVSDYLDPNNKELLQDFFAEAESQIQLLEMNILALENDPGNKEAVDEIFRAAHTLKGGAATVQMDELAEFTHLVEDVLDDVRSGNIIVDSGTVTCLLESIDVIKAMISNRMEGRVYKKNISGIKEKLKNYLSGSFQNEDNKADADEMAMVQQEDGGLSEYEILELKEIAGKDGKIYCVRVNFNEDNPMNTVGGIQVYAILKNTGKILRTIPEFELLYEDNYFPVVEYYIVTKKKNKELESMCRITDVTTDIQVLDIDKLSQKKPAEKTLHGKAAEKKESRKVKKENLKESIVETEEKDEEKESSSGNGAVKKSNFGSVLRVDSRRIDELLNLVTETVINKATFNQINLQFNELMMKIQETEEEYKEQVKNTLQYLNERIQDFHDENGSGDLKSQVQEQFNAINSLYSSFNNDLKSTISLFKNTTQSLNRISSNLQTGVMQIRMVHVSQIFSRFPRLVRDLSRQLDKKVKLQITGEETELDKSVIEDLLDPLIHCVRNSIDHGIEVPEDRAAAGKPEEGIINLRADNEGNMIIIEIEDDGKGIDVEFVKQRAIERGLIHPSKNLSDIEAFNLIFEPGFSTAESVTNISGRGVGLDVVKKQIEKLSGSVSVWSELGVGTKFTIQLPLTLAIIPGLLIRVGKENYAIPIATVVESMRLKPEQIRTIDNYEVFDLRDDVISLIRLDRIFNIPREGEREHYFAVIVGSGEKKVGLIVDTLIGEEDVVIKPLKDRFTNTPGIAGATILGDGTVALIIDINQLLDFGMKQERAGKGSRRVV